VTRGGCCGAHGPGGCRCTAACTCGCIECRCAGGSIRRTRKLPSAALAEYAWMARSHIGYADTGPLNLRRLR
jgi:hypothetical protein